MQAAADWHVYYSNHNLISEFQGPALTVASCQIKDQTGLRPDAMLVVVYDVTVNFAINRTTLAPEVVSSLGL